MSTLAAHLESPNGRPRSRNLWRTYSVSGWISACTVGPQRLSVRDNRSRTYNVSESYHSALRRISNLFTKISNFHGHIQRATVDYMTDVARANNGLSIHRPKKESNLLNEARIKACINKFDSGVYDAFSSSRLLSTVLVRTLHLFTTVPPVLTTTTTTTTRFPNHLFPLTLQPLQPLQRPDRRHMR